MGFGLPAAMGAAVGRPDKETWAIVGDGGLQMTSQELMTLVQDRIPVKVALLDNHKLGMIRQWQELVYAGNYHSSELLGPDWLKLAEAYGVPGFRATTPDEVDAAIAAARAVDGPALVHFDDRRAAERLPDDAGRQGFVGPARGTIRGAQAVTPTGQPTGAAPAHTAPPARLMPGKGEAHRHVLVAIVMNKPGVLNRVASLMRARNFNIETLAVSHTDQPEVSRMTITLRGDDVAVEQAAKQLYRLIDVLKVQDVT